MADQAVENKNLMESEELLRAILEAAVDAIITIDDRGIVQSLNPATEQLFGYSAQELLGQNVKMLMPSPYRDEHDDYIQNYLRTGDKKIIGIGRDVVGRRKDGRVFPMHLAVSEVKLPGRRLFTGIVRDISERKQHEQQLAESESFLQTIFDTEPECVKLLAPGGVLRMMNRAGLAMIEADSLEQVEGQCIYPLVDPEYRAAFQSLNERVFRGASGTLEFELVGRKGTRRRLQTHAVPLRNSKGEITTLLAISCDVTERKKAQEEVRESQRMLSTLISNLPGAAYRRRHDENWTTEFISDGIYELTGYEPSELTDGKVTLGGDIIHADDRKEVRSVVQAGLAEHLPYQLVYRITHANGEVKWVREQGQGVYATDGELVALEGFMTDISEQKRAEQALRLAAIGEMMTGIAHESRNALQRSQACVEMLELDLEDNEDALEQLRKIQRAQYDLQRLFGEVGEYAAPIHLECSDYPLSRIWQEAWDLVAAPRSGRNANLSEQTDGLDLTCFVDRFRLVRVFRNLLENSLAACVDPVQIEIDCTEASHQGRSAIRLAYRDNGPGLSEEERQRVFEPFFTNKTRGSGLGMSIAARIVEAHGGVIATGKQDHPNAGAEFIVTLPRRKA